MQKYFIYIQSAAICLLLFASCQKGEINSLNTPTVGGITANPSRSDLFNLVTGAESGMRRDIAAYLDDNGVIGREIYRFSGSEPRYTTDLLGGGTKTLDNNTFYLTNPWSGRYSVIRQCFLIMDGIRNTQTTVANDAQKKAFTGFAKTLIGYQLLLNFNLTYSNGIRVPSDDPKQVNPIITNTDQALDSILNFLDAGKADLTGSDVIFPLSGGFAGFNDAAGLLKFNRAIAARVAVYRKNWTGALAALNESFFNLTGDFNTGVYHTFSTNGGDIANTMFLPPNNTGEVRVAHPTFAADISAGDDRINKTSLRSAPASQSGLTGNRDLALWPSLSSPITIIRNEELILIYAEAKIQLNQFPDAIIAINRIRTAHGLPAYAGAVTQAALITEMLNQRRYSLFMEGHRWIDLRRYNLLGTLPKDRPDDDVWDKFPLPQSESNI
ncbi:RagB/SusD family nutrient uptake outer membrane protein [Chitinophaga vietnamensis]|uniref:RagB/SusD family nutrient uptake outer membrane protein n=1 Tax=Chitinophaga vietnamensis TaxID=2593957 RepID=UPI001177CA11|nr:RagB/SusD family nutrient uptake outer membrane protein [Chitinophaga vietnamensis]